MSTATRKARRRTATGAPIVYTDHTRPRWVCLEPKCGKEGTGDPTDPNVEQTLRDALNAHHESEHPDG